MKNFALLALLLLSSCAAGERLSNQTPWSAIEGQQSSLPLFPLAYSSQNGSSALWPLLDWDRQGWALRPLAARQNDRTELLWPFIKWSPGHFAFSPVFERRHDSKGCDWRLSPLIAWGDSDAHVSDWHAFHLMGWQRRGDETASHLHPLFWRRHGGDDDWEASCLLNLGKVWSNGDKSGWHLFPLIKYRRFSPAEQPLPGGHGDSFLPTWNGADCGGVEIDTLIWDHKSSYSLFWLPGQLHRDEERLLAAWWAELSLQPSDGGKPFVPGDASVERLLVRHGVKPAGRSRAELQHALLEWAGSRGEVLCTTRQDDIHLPLIEFALWQRVRHLSSGQSELFWGFLWDSQDDSKSSEIRILRRLLHFQRGPEGRSGHILFIPYGSATWF
jgi:hypothetical protein